MDSKGKLIKRPPLKNAPTPQSRRSVLLIHGLERLPCTMKVLEWRFRRAGWEVYQYEYPCHQISFYDAAEALCSHLQLVKESERPNFGIGFSMGGVILDLLLKEWSGIQRAILVGSPLTHSQAAEITLRIPLAKQIFGPSLEALAKRRTFSPTPTTELALLAGYGPIQQSWNPLLKGPNDGLVRLEEALPTPSLPQATFRALHLGLVLKRGPFEVMKHFLEQGEIMSLENKAKR